MRPHGTAAPSADGTFLDFLGIVAQVTDTPEEPEDGTSGPEGRGEGGLEEFPDGMEPPRGWIDPDDRLWRHPSEVAGPGPRPELRFPLEHPARHPYRSAVMVLVGVGAVMAVVAWIIVLLSPASDHPLESAGTLDSGASSPLTTLAGKQNALPAAAEAAGHSLVELQANTSHGRVILIGVAVAEGGLVATTADVLDGLQSIVMVGPGGKLQPASVVAMDKTSDVALVNVPEDLPVAPFASDIDLGSGDPDLTLTYVSASDGTSALLCTPGAVAGVGAPIGNGPATTMPAITSSPASPSVIAGEPLLNAQGSIVGMLYGATSGGTTASAAPSTFLPSDLVVGVANELRSQNRVVHGWLGVQGTDAPDDAGAKVAQVTSGGPAAGHLQVGQLITAVNATPVRSMAELRAVLYVLPPGTAVSLSVQQPAGTVDVTLGTSS
jgi:S1-C subfamily serine protease